MTFTFVDDEPDEEEIWRCTECGWLSTKRHFRDGPRCSLCHSRAEQIGVQENSNEMPAFQYQQILTYLDDEVSGVGSATIDNIKDAFENGDDFLDVVRDAYDEQAYEPLTDISGIGESTARKIALGMADERGWEDGLAESKFKVA
jgi:hypothetical protein